MEDVSRLVQVKAAQLQEGRETKQVVQELAQVRREGRTRLPAATAALTTADLAAALLRRSRRCCAAAVASC